VTFSHYFGFEHFEFALMLGGLILIATSIFLIRFLGTFKNGFTSQRFMSSQFLSENTQAFVMSQTLGGNTVGSEQAHAKGGEFGGGGASGTF
jgi:hypothetical protein